MSLEGSDRTNNGHVIWGHCEQWPFEQWTFAVHLDVHAHIWRAKPRVSVLDSFPPSPSYVLCVVAPAAASRSSLSSLPPLTEPVILTRRFYRWPQLCRSRPPSKQQLLCSCGSRDMYGLRVREGQWLTQVHEFRRSLFSFLRGREGGRDLLSLYAIGLTIVAAVFFPSEACRYKHQRGSELCVFFFCRSLMRPHLFFFTLCCGQCVAACCAQRHLGREWAGVGDCGCLLDTLETPDPRICAAVFGSERLLQGQRVGQRSLGVAYASSLTCFTC